MLHCDAPKEIPQINAQQPVAETMKVLEPQIFRFAEMILRDRCSTSYDLALIFRGRSNTLDRWAKRIAKRIGTRPSALYSTFHF